MFGTLREAIATVWSIAVEYWAVFSSARVPLPAETRRQREAS
jgi:hypothetical protein